MRAIKFTLPQEKVDVYNKTIKKFLKDENIPYTEENLSQEEFNKHIKDIFNFKK